MPEDQTGFLVRHLIETTWPSVVLLACAAAVAGWMAVQRDDRRTLVIAAILAVLSIGVGVVGTLVETDREQVLAATRAFVQDAVDGDVPGLVGRLHRDATLHAGAVEAPGYPREDLERAFDQLDGVHRIKQNTITLLDAAADDGVVWTELACLTRTDSSYGTVPSRWIFEWMRTTDEGAWRIRSVSAISVAGRSPSGRDVLR